MASDRDVDFPRRLFPKSGARKMVGSGLIENWIAGKDDLIGGIRNWRVCHFIGIGEIRRRYSRSVLGQFWLTLSTLLLVIILSVVWAELWKVPLEKLMPYIGTSLIFWQFVSGVVGEAPSTLEAAGRLYLNQGMSFSTAIMAALYKQFIMFLHNIPVILLLLLWFGRPIPAMALWSIVGLFLVILALYWISYLLAIVCLRYRDLSQVVASMMTVLFYVTPILWIPDQITGPIADFIFYNPFAAMVLVVRDPLLGVMPPSSAWTMMIALAFGGLFASLAVVGKFQKRIIYWI